MLLLQLKIKEHQSEQASFNMEAKCSLRCLRITKCFVIFIHSERGLDCPCGIRDSIHVVALLLEVVSLDRERVLLLLFKDAAVALDSMLRASPRTADCDFE